MLPEIWNLISRDDTECVVARTIAGKTCIYHLEAFGTEWRKVRVYFSKINPGMNRKPERLKLYYEGNACPCHPAGVKLTDQRLDRMLLGYCNG